MKQNISSQRGYIAIVASIIIAILLLMVAITLGLSAFSSRINNLDFYSKRISYFVARSCLDKTLLEISKNPAYAGNATTTVDVYQCFTFPVETVGGNKAIKARAQVNGATTNLKLTISAATLSTIFLEEVSKF